MTSVKEQVQKLAETLPENATWDQAMYELYVRSRSPKARRPLPKAASSRTRKSRSASLEHEDRLVGTGPGRPRRHLGP